MMCSLLALATGLALGSQIAPTATDAAPAVLPALGDRLQAWVRHDAEPALPSTAPTIAAGPEISTDLTLEGGRAPRMPRTSREALARPMR